MKGPGTSSRCCCLRSSLDRARRYRLPVFSLLGRQGVPVREQDPHAAQDTEASAQLVVRVVDEE